MQLATSSRPCPSSLPFNPLLALFLPFLPAHRCNLWTGSGRREGGGGGRDRGGRGSDKSLVVKRGDHGGERVFNPLPDEGWNRIVFFDGGGEIFVRYSAIWNEFSSTSDKQRSQCFSTVSTGKIFLQKY